MGVRVVIGGSVAKEFRGHNYESDENPSLRYVICEVGAGLGVKKYHRLKEDIVYATTCPATMSYIEDE